MIYESAVCCVRLRSELSWLAPSVTVKWHQTHLASKYQVQLQASNAGNLTLHESSFHAHHILDETLDSRLLDQFVDDLCFGFSFKTFLHEVEAAI